MEPSQPYPDERQEKVSDLEARPPRAKLKIFFGMAPGVGKTYTMLKVARELKDEGAEIVIGVIETHGRADTAALAEGFESIPKKTLPCRGVFVEEFDLQAAIARKPQIILMDELAHANVHGSLHQRRWQDVWDLLDAGIEVYTTVNVQHIESLRDVVAQITGIIVRESIPDTILNRADEIEIVDIPPDELIQRLKEGKVHIPDQVRHATERFFRKGNLLALRELALRRVAEHVDADMRRYMSSEGIGKTWAAAERLLVCISPREESARLIRATKRMAESLNAPWIAVYVENARGLRHSAEERARLEEHLRLAERLGGETLVTQGGLHIAQDLINLATFRNVTKIIIGKPRKARWIEFFTGSLLAELVRRSGSIDVHVITGEGDSGTNKPIHLNAPLPRLGSVGHLLWAAVAVLAATGVGMLIAKRLELSEIVMVYLLAILVVGLRFGRSASLAASILSVITLDLVFIPPAFSLAVDEFKHFGTFAMLLAVGYIIGNLVERIHAQTRLARTREQRTLALFRLTNELTRSAGSAAMVESAVHSVANQFQSKVAILLPDALGRLRGLGGKTPEELSPDELGVAQWTFDHHEAAGMGTDILPGAQALYLPLNGAKSILGVMGVRPDQVPRWMEPDQRHLLEAFANQIALALERVFLAEKNAESSRKADRERMQNAVLSSVSQDLQAPLSAIAGAVSTLLDAGHDPGPAVRRELLEVIQEDAHHLHRLVMNLLDMTQLDSGTLEIKKSRVSMEELVSSALGRCGAFLGDRRVAVELPLNMPVVSVDAALMERAILNLLENAHRYSPSDQPIEIKGWATDRAVTLAIADHGPGIPEGAEERIFQKLVRIPRGTARQGAGLGLAICKGIVEAHGGWIQAGNRSFGGAQILLSIPVEPCSA